MRILLVEDTDFVAEMIIDSLERDGGHEVTWSTGLTSAWHYLLPGQTYDCAILDNQLGDGYGTELIPKLKDRGIPCCVFSGLPPIGLDVPTFSKSRPEDLFKWIKKVEAS